MRNCFEWASFMIDEHTAAKEELPSREADISHVENLINLQENGELKIAPNLGMQNVHPGHFSKMKVSNATNLFSHASAMAVVDQVLEGSLEKEALTTAWLMEFGNDWFSIACNRTFAGSMFRNSDKVVKMEQMIEVIKGFTFCKNGKETSTMKPWQKGMLLTTTSIIELFRDLMSEPGYNFLITGRLSQDALENLFSQVRGLGDAHPSFVRFRHALRHITFSQMMAVPTSSSYDVDDSSHLLDFLKSQQKQSNVILQCNDVIQDDGCFSVPESFIECEELDEQISHDDELTMQAHGIFSQGLLEGKALYYLAGWTAAKIKKRIKCAACNESLTTEFPTVPESSFTTLKTYCSGAGLTHPSNEVYELIKFAENEICLADLRAPNIQDELVQRVMRRKPSLSSPCNYHNLCHLVLNRFIKFRLHIRASFSSQHLDKKGQFASKSAASRTTIS